MITVQKRLQFLPCKRIHLRLHSTEALLHLDDVLLCVKNLLVDGPVSGHILILRQIADGGVFCKDHLAGIRRLFLHNNFKQRRLAGTIDADNRCFFICFDMKTYIFENFVCPE